MHNHGEDNEDEGIIWFDESNAEDTVLKTLATYDLSSGGDLDREQCRFLDLGTGNGHMLFALREDENDLGERWVSDMVGVDYSPKSIELAKQIDAQRRAALETDEQDWAEIQFEHWDLLTEAPSKEWLRDGFDVVLDKGTFDAISLMPHSEHEPHPCEIYRRRVVSLIKPRSFLFITSCNWTRDELIEWLAPGRYGLRYHDEAKYPTFTFGGQTGQSVVTLIFRKDTGNAHITRTSIISLEGTSDGAV